MRSAVLARRLSRMSLTGRVHLHRTSQNRSMRIVRRPHNRMIKMQVMPRSDDWPHESSNACGNIRWSGECWVGGSKDDRIADWVEGSGIEAWAIGPISDGGSGNGFGWSIRLPTKRWTGRGNGVRGPWCCKEQRVLCSRLAADRSRCSEMHQHRTPSKTP